MPLLRRYNKDYYAGALMIVIGLTAAYGARRYPIGTLEHMGAGFFPTSVGVLLSFVGVVIALGASPAVDDTHTEARPEWRGWTCIIGGIVAFVLLGVYGGLIPATFSIVFISALGDRRNTVQTAFLLAVAMVAISVIVFGWALRIQLPLFAFG